MSDINDTETKGRLSLRPATRSDVGRTVDAGSVRQSFSHGRTKVVQVEMRKKRTPSAAPGAPGSTAPAAGTAAPSAEARAPSTARPSGPSGRQLTANEIAVRQRVLAEQQREAARRDQERREQEKISILSAAEEARRREEESKRAAEDEARKAAEEDARRRAAEEEARRVAELAATAEATVSVPAAPTPQPAPATAEAASPARPATTAPATPTQTLRLKPARPQEDDEAPRRRPGVVLPGRKPGVPAQKKVGDGRRAGRIDVLAAIEGEDEKSRSLASVRRQRERERRQAELEMLRSDQMRVVRDVVIPETITVQELAARMAARMPDVIKSLMKMGMMATPAQVLDADTAELIVQEFGHRVRRVSEADVELGIDGQQDEDIELEPRPPVVTIMGHVDHGKTSLLDALRSTDVAGGEAGGITQHIGAYQVTTRSGNKITFIDTPGHEAFTAMRSRGASVTDIVILVVAADDGVMPQTIEAIRHAKAADAPIIVAINKIDKADANPSRVRQELLTHEIVVEEMGGETQDVEVSATQMTGLDKLEEAIMLQAEILELRANPNRAAEGSVIESRLDRGRGPVATMLVQKGTLRQGEIVVAGAEWGRIRAMLDDKGQQIKSAEPSTPVEILGLSAVPSAGEPFVAVDNEARAREISEFRQRKLRDRNAAGATAARGTLEEMLARAAAGELKEVALLIKADVQGSAEALQGAVLKQAHEEVKVRVLLAAVGQITESDVQLAKASGAVIVAFNVRATAQARELAQRDGVDIRYYSIIYDVADDVEKLVRGKVAPKARENFLGYAEVRKVFDITKVGKVAGCMVTEGLVKRGAGVRLLREGVVIHNGQLSQLKRF
ncbi:MAG: translation initiation factor IF-2, partial [Acetobacteraceae bacterium]|nr:translation initiation factor IF-2 [Acetobacteraceae bacterium]